MGRGDIKTKKGKIFSGSFGKSRPAKPKKAAAAKAAKQA
jgi:30S ribosomal protein S31